VILRKARKHGLPAPVSEVIVPLFATASNGPGYRFRTPGAQMP
jgi:2-dehydropantoate 2-reductase